ncbi:hypothetical protein MPH_03264 [Macrophomina phaseolina MS6]|uniref:Uncharacterized protein n=1 Tax=Macrophomina phaseolina (strain MS6) TaxID=1126212 RepID=K2RA91_MACPH|nr:hypothetical protein MPH_03264 [Macrophomina phaseolina MS6]
MSGNLNLVARLVSKLTYGDLETQSTSVLHLAINYLDGGNACCSVLRVLVDSDLPHRNRVDENCYALFDSLMATIVKSHTELRPSDLDGSNKGERFPGDEISTCGRWDADADCVQELCSAGHSRAPLHWKHKFCHSSVQAVCHSIYPVCMLATHYEGSGLFLKRRTGCGLKLELSQFHTLVMVAFLPAEEEGSG